MHFENITTMAMLGMFWKGGIYRTKIRYETFKCFKQKVMVSGLGDDKVQRQYGSGGSGEVEIKGKVISKGKEMSD